MTEPETRPRLMNPPMNGHCREYSSPAQQRLRHRSGPRRPQESLPNRIQVSFRVHGWPSMNDTFMYPVNEPLREAFETYAAHVRYHCHCGLEFRPQGREEKIEESMTLLQLHARNQIDLARRVIYIDVNNTNPSRRYY